MLFGIMQTAMGRTLSKAYHESREDEEDKVIYFVH